MRKENMEREGRGAGRSKGNGEKNKMLFGEDYGHADILKSERKRKHS